MSLKDYSQYRFMVVDDFANFRNTLWKMLSDLGAKHVDKCANGRDAVKMCHEVNYDVIISDYNLGEGQNGQQILEEVRQKRLLKYTSAFIITTAEVSKDIVLSAIEYQPDSYLAKPFTLEVLKKRIDNTLKQKQELASILSALDKEDKSGALLACEEHIKTASKYTNWCLKTKVELLFDTREYKQALEVCRHALSNKHLDWAELFQGKILVELEQYDKAKEVLEDLLKKNPMSMAAYDWLAKICQNKDDTEQAQILLEKALSLSSKSVKRQKQYAKVCSENNDLDKAAQAFRKTIGLATHSIHHSAENTFDLAQCLTDAAAQSSPEEAKRLAREAIDNLEQASKEFNNTEVDLNAKLLESRVYCAVKDEKKADEALQQANKLSDKIDSVSPATRLQFAKSLMVANQEDKAKEMLTALANDYPDDTDIGEHIDQLVDEPISNSGKTIILGINKSGVSKFQAKDFDAAINEFTKAIKRYPKHIGLNLNLVQSQVAKMDAQGVNTSMIKDCQSRIKKLQYLNEEHELYQRLQNLDKKLNQIIADAAKK